MKLFEIVNGYIGESYVRCLVVAESEERAIELARPKFKSESYPKNIYAERYYNELKANVIVDDLTKEYIGEVTDR